MFFGTSGELSTTVLRALALDHDVAGVVRPAGTRVRQGSWAGAGRSIRRARDWLLGRREIGQVWEANAGADSRIAELVQRARVDLICIAGYPWVLPCEILRLAPLGAVNLHGALLPRHRGPLPLFWVYYCDDRESGVTVHHATERADAGEILAQDRFPLARGFPVDQLNRLNSVRGATLFRHTLGALAAGTVIATPQDEARATAAPRVRLGQGMVDFTAWDVERVWHFLAGLYPRFQEPLVTGDGRPVTYGGVAGYTRCDMGRPPGSAIPGRHGWDLHCNGGVVHLRSSRTSMAPGRSR